VCYIPGESPPHPEMIDEELHSWAVQLEDDTLLIWPYLPGELRTSWQLTFLRRGQSGYRGLQPSQPTGLWEGTVREHADG